MIDLNLLRENPTQFINLIKSGRGNIEKTNIKRWMELDSKRKELILERDLINKERNNIASLGKENVEIARARGKELKNKLEFVEEDLKRVESEWQEIIDWIPNLPLDSVPQGKDSSENVEIKVWEKQRGYLPEDKIGIGDLSAQFMSTVGVHQDREFETKPHWEVGEKLGLFNLESGAKISGSRFYYITGDGALLVYATFNLLFRKLISENFVPMIVPLIVKERALYGSSHFPGDSDQVYKLENKYFEDSDSLFLIGSSEPSNFGYFMDQVLDLNQPIKIMAQTPCFRSEVGSWGRDVRGIKRTHQFDKLEMNIIMQADIEKTIQMHEYLLSINEWLLQSLEIPYRVINMCIGDLGYNAAAKKYDVEFWTPSQNCYTEIMSNSITTDYQSRRLNIKYRDQNDNLKYAYTLNDTGITHRILIAIMEHYQQSDGSLLIPNALRDFVGKDRIKL